LRKTVQWFFLFPLIERLDKEKNTSDFKTSSILYEIAGWIVSAILLAAIMALAIYLFWHVIVIIVFVIGKINWSLWILVLVAMVAFFGLRIGRK
jgi:hypothetical protein